MNLLRPKADIALASRIAFNCELVSARQVASSAACALIPAPGSTLATDFNVPAGTPVQEGDALRVRLKSEFQARSEGKKTLVASISSEWELVYVLHPALASALDPAELHAFASTSASMNAWPLIREFIHSTLMRLGMPPFTLPVLTLCAQDDAVPASAPTAPPSQRRALAAKRRTLKA